MKASRAFGNGSRDVWYERLGADRADPLACLVLHGGPGFTSLSIRSGLAPLAVRRSVVVLDLPGCGLSSRHPASGYAMDEYVLDVLHVVDALQVSRCVLVGHGWGAILACRVSLASGGRVAGIVMVNPLRVLTGDGQDEGAQHREMARVDASLEDRYHALAPMLAKARAGDPAAWDAIDADSWPRDMFETQFATPPPDEWRADMRAAALGYESYFSHKGSALFDPDSLWARYDLRSDAATLAHPVLFLAGDADANYVAPIHRHAALLAEAMTDARLVVLPGCGHFLPVERPDAFASHVDAFMASLTEEGVA